MAITPGEAMGNIKTPAANRSPATSATTTRADRRHRGPLDSNHPCGSMRRCAGLLALWHEAVRTRHACYRAMRFIHGHFEQDPGHAAKRPVPRLHSGRQSAHGRRRFLMPRAA
jgi:hypothetical protein